MTKLFNPLAMISALIILAIAVAAWLLPMQFAHNIKLKIESETGRSFSVKGGAGWTLMPSPALILSNVQLDGVSALSPEILIAKTMTVDVFGAIRFEEAEVTIATQEPGHANFLTGQESEDLKIAPRRIHFHKSKFHFVNVVSPMNIDIADITGSFDLSELGVIQGSGSGSLGGRTAQFSTSIGSIPRTIKDGSPFELSINTLEEQFSFAGRLSLKNGLNLVGQATVDVVDLGKTLAWAGIGMKAIKPAQKLNLSGSIEIQNSDISLKSAQLNLANMKAQGDIELSFEGKIPTMSAALGFDVFDLNTFSITQHENWSEVPFDLSSLQALKLEFKIRSNKFVYKAQTSGPATLNGMLNVGAITSNFISDTGSKIETFFDGRSLKLNAHIEKYTAPLGVTSFDANLQALGNSEAEMVSKLAGEVSGTVADLHLNNSNASGQFNLEINEGIATMAENQMQIGAEKFTMLGEVDVLRRSVSLSTSTLAGKKLLIHGPWSKPMISEIATTLQ